MEYSALTEAGRPTNKQLKTAALNVWQGMTKEETHPFVTVMSSSLQAVTTTVAAV